MKAFLIDPLRVGTRVVAEVDAPDPSLVRALLGIPPEADLEAVDVPQSGTLYFAGPSHSEGVRRLGEFRIRKLTGDHRSVAGRGVLVGFAGGAGEVLDLLASSGVWVAA